MNAHVALELFGYAGSVLVAVSLMMRSLVRLRIINFAGALVFAIYGLLIKAYPVAGLNAAIAIVDVWYLVQMWSKRDYFQLLEVTHDSEYLRGFVDFHRADIAGFIPDYTYEPQPGQISLLVLRDMVPAGVLLLRQEGSDTRVMLDFVIVGYRDFGVGRFLFEDNAAYFRQHGITRFVSAPGHPRHAAYLARMGFRLEGGNWVRELGPAALRDHAL
jgi:hypothetical protein